jgi:hypothetical protein
LAAIYKDKMFGLFKTKEIEITNKEKFEKTLVRLIELLRNNSHDGQANVVNRLLDALTQEDKKEFIRILTSVDMWGGSGAVWEVGTFKSDRDEREFWRQLIQLTEDMKEIGIKCGRAYSTADIFRKELKRNKGE